MHNYKKSLGFINDGTPKDHYIGLIQTTNKTLKKNKGVINLYF